MKRRIDLTGTMGVGGYEVLRVTVRFIFQKLIDPDLHNAA